MGAPARDGATTYVDLHMHSTASDGHLAPEAVIAEYAKDAPIGRLIRPAEVAAAVLYLCSAEAAAVTGTTLAVAGGEM